MYAALKAQRLKQLEEKDSGVADSEIYETLARKGDFPLVSKQLNEALQNRSMGTNTFLPPVLTSPDWSEFAPSSGQTPGEVISGVLRALREGNRVAEVEETENTGVPTLLRFLSPASSFGSEPVDDEDFIAFVMDSEYDILLRWEDLSFKGTMNLNVDGNRAFQTVQLQDPWSVGEEGRALSLRDAADCRSSAPTTTTGLAHDNVCAPSGARAGGVARPPPHAAGVAATHMPPLLAWLAPSGRCARDGAVPGAAGMARQSHQPELVRAAPARRSSGVAPSSKATRRGRRLSDAQSAAAGVAAPWGSSWASSCWRPCGPQPVHPDAVWAGRGGVHGSRRRRRPRRDRPGGCTGRRGASSASASMAIVGLSARCAAPHLGSPSRCGALEVEGAFPSRWRRRGRASRPLAVLSAPRRAKPVRLSKYRAGAPLKARRNFSLLIRAGVRRRHARRVEEARARGLCTVEGARISRASRPRVPRMRVCTVEACPGGKI